MKDPLLPALQALHGPSYGWAVSCCGYDRAEARDVLQEAYLKILEGRARPDGRAALRTFLFGVIRRTAAERRRRRWLRRTLLDRWWQPARPAAGPEVDAERGEEAARVVRALSALPARQREVLELVYYQDLTIAEAAAVMGVALGTARIHHERGKRRLAEVLR